MIACLSGQVLTTSLDSVVLDVGGVGMAVMTTPATAASLKPGTQGRLETVLIVREDSLTLYGFANNDEKKLFEQVLTVSGIGPRLALAMLAVHEPASLSSAISSGNVTALTKVPGIGKKGAERIVLELRDKVFPVGASEGAPAMQHVVSNREGRDEQVASALIGLGWSVKQSDEALAKVTKLPEAEGAGTAALLRLALKELGR